MENKAYLLQYHLSRRQDEGWGRLALVYAKDLEEAKNKLIKEKTIEWSDALSHGLIEPDNIISLNIY